MSSVGKYRALIVDIDGTLYFQMPVRLCMAVSMLAFLVTHPFRRREVFLVLAYRKLYASGVGDAISCSRLAEQYHLPVCEVEKTIDKWMIKKPLPYVRAFRDRKLIAALKSLQEQMVKVIVYSDYPVVDKLSALGFLPDGAYSADDVGCLKPAAEGLLHILGVNGLEVPDCLFIGDRYDKDGKCAESAGMDYFVLPQCGFARRRFYSSKPFARV